MTNQILVLEEDAALRESLVTVLQRLGLETRAPEDEKEVGEALEDEAPVSLVLSDLELAARWWDFVQRKQINRPELWDVPIVIVSDLEELPESLIGFHADGWLKKPIYLEDLMMAVSRRNSGMVH